ncbi:MAG: glycoside hydrolase family 97 catalytic domain-containing protein [Planctomycetes bacterium]|nr:glycoside hydrolase family 97 catalytic domain-containing protein [Planctomycetota bacterium]
MIVRACRRVAWVGVLIATFARAQDTAAREFELKSPDGRIALRIRFQEPGSTDLPRWSASFAGERVLEDCRLGLEVEDDGELLAGAMPSDVTRRSHDERIAVRFGKAEYARDRFEELRLVCGIEGRLPVQIVLRCHDDAIAFRYELPPAPGRDALRVLAEGSTFGLAGDPRIHTQFLPHFRTSHEHEVRDVSLGEVPAGQLLDVPLTVAREGGPFLSITEAALLRYAGMSLRRDGTSRQLTAAFAPRDDGAIAVRSLPFVTPWRVVLVADRLGALLESQTLYCLNEAPDFDPSWVKPGKLTWPWWNGYRFEKERGEPILSLNSAKQHIDWCAANGIAFHALVADETDTPWYVQSKPGLFPDPGADATRARADFDLPAIRDHATARGVRLWTWVHHEVVRGREEEVFAAFERLGWSGVMVDFLDRDDQATVEFAEAVLHAAARHHVLVHFHGMYKPSGWQRTFPHLMNHEGSLNLEYLKWTARCTPEHTLRVAFTRLIAGPMDYHLGGFRAVLPKDFAPRNDAPNVLGTRGHQLALYVVLDNPSPMVADYPAAYRDQPGFDFVVAVPTWWDETRVLDAAIGRVLVTARRRDGEWWLGAATAGEAREIVVPLSFLPEGPLAMQLWRDGDGVAVDPNALAIEEREVARKDVLRVRVGSGGGFVARIGVKR